MNASKEDELKTQNVSDILNKIKDELEAKLNAKSIELEEALSNNNDKLKL